MYWVRLFLQKRHKRDRAIHRIKGMDFAEPLKPGEVRVIGNNGEWQDLFSLTPDPLEAILRPDEIPPPKDTPERRKAILELARGLKQAQK